MKGNFEIGDSELVPLYNMVGDLFFPHRSPKVFLGNQIWVADPGISSPTFFFLSPLHPSPKLPIPRKKATERYLLFKVL